jgi:deoxyribodipyrimidine photo-lyase
MRRALRTEDQAPLWHAAQDAEEVIPVVCLRDTAPYRKVTPRRVFIASALRDLERDLLAHGARLAVRVGPPEREIPAVAAAYGAEAVYACQVADPSARSRDERIAQALRRSGARWEAFKDAVLFDGGEILNASGTPYRVFTPYRNAWRERAMEAPRPYPGLGRITSPPPGPGETTLDGCPGFSAMPGRAPAGRGSERLKEFISTALRHYRQRRDMPGVDGTSRLSAHLAHGTLSIRTVYREVMEERRRMPRNARESADVFVSELIWREFYHQILHHFPHAASGAFRPEFDGIAWSTNRRRFAAWCDGRTGYPIVDAGMRQLEQEGWMHNRARMIVASFLTKDLHISWQWGEQYFLERLADADLASNNGGWQWCAGTGTDASPWFRIFNPVLQGEKFDPRGEYVRRYVPELSGVDDRRIHRPWDMTEAEQRLSGCRIGHDYPAPIVRHDEERRVTLDLYRNPGARARGSSGRRHA